MFKKIKVIFTRELKDFEKIKLTQKFIGCYFCLKEVLKDKYLILCYNNFTCLKAILKYYKKFDCKFEIVK